MSELAWTTPPQEPEGIRWDTVITILVTTLVVFGIGVAVQWAMAGALMRRLNPAYPDVPGAVGQPTINVLEQREFGVAERGLDLAAEHRRSLDRWGWVDRARGTVHEPIEDVFRRMAAEPAAGGR